MMDMMREATVGRSASTVALSYPLLASSRLTSTVVAPRLFVSIPAGTAILGQGMGHGLNQDKWQQRSVPNSTTQYAKQASRPGTEDRAMKCDAVHFSHIIPGGNV